MNIPTKKILMFNIAPEKELAIRKICTKMQAAPVNVTPFEHGKMIGELAGMLPGDMSLNTPINMPTNMPQNISNTANNKPKQKKTENNTNLSSVTGEMLIFSLFKDNELDTFLAEYKTSGVAPVELKAVLTPYNMLWTCGKLYSELSEEHKMMK